MDTGTHRAKWVAGGLAVALIATGAIAGAGIVFADGPIGAHMAQMGDVDRHFIEMMIPHHQNAVTMADLALAQAEHPEIKTLATAIKTTQTAEIATMRAWYKAWYGTDVPVVTMPMMNHVEATTLDGAKPFDKLFIEQMVPHHEMAVQMSTMALTGAKQPELRTLLQSIVTSQQAEINSMRDWYQTWYGVALPGANHPMGEGHGYMRDGRGMMTPGQGPIGPGRATITPGQGPFNPGQGPMTPGQGPRTPGQGPVNPDQRPFIPGQGPQNPGQGPATPGQGAGPQGQGPANPFFGMLDGFLGRGANR